MTQGTSSPKLHSSISFSPETTSTSSSFPESPSSSSPSPVRDLLFPLLRIRLPPMDSPPPSSPPPVSTSSDSLFRPLPGPDSSSPNSASVDLLSAYFSDYEFHYDVETLLGTSVGEIVTKLSQSAQHVLKTLEEMTGVPIAEIRVIHCGRILHTDSTIADHSVKDWLSTGNECSIPIEYFADLEFSHVRVPLSNEPFPLKFVIVNGERAGDVLVMTHATRRTTAQDIVEWMSSESANVEEGAVSFFFENFGKTQYFPLHEEPWVAQNAQTEKGAVALRPSEAIFICNFLCADKTIPVSMKRWSDASVEKKSLTLVLSEAAFASLAGIPAADLGMWETTLQSSDYTAPEWRRAEPGLCLEGMCINVACRANGSMVIVNKGFTDFDVDREYNDCQCPVCHKPVAPTKPGFSNCFWRIKAVNFHTKATLDTYWTKTENDYFTFDADACGMTSFSSLRIFIRPFNEKYYSDIPVPVPKSCTICFQSIRREELHVLPCQKIIHKNCNDKWALEQRNMSCPFCDAQHPSTVNADGHPSVRRVSPTGEDAVLLLGTRKGFDLSGIMM